MHPYNILVHTPTRHTQVHRVQHGPPVWTVALHLYWHICRSGRDCASCVHQTEAAELCVAQGCHRLRTFSPCIHLAETNLCSCDRSDIRIETKMGAKQWTGVHKTRAVIRVYNTDMATLNTQTMLLSCKLGFFLNINTSECERSGCSTQPMLFSPL